MNLERWQPGDPLAAAKLNQPVDALNALPRQSHEAPGLSGRTYHWGRIISVTATAVVDGNTEPAQWTAVVHEGGWTKAGYGSPTDTVFTVWNEGVGFRGTAYWLESMEIDGSEVPADLKMIAPVVGRLVFFTIIMVPSGNGFIQQAIILTPLSAECA